MEPRTNAETEPGSETRPALPKLSPEVFEKLLEPRGGARAARFDARAKARDGLGAKRHQPGVVDVVRAPEARDPASLRVDGHASRRRKPGGLAALDAEVDLSAGTQEPTEQRRPIEDVGLADQARALQFVGDPGEGVRVRALFPVGMIIEPQLRVPLHDLFDVVPADEDDILDPALRKRREDPVENLSV